MKKNEVGTFSRLLFSSTLKYFQSVIYFKVTQVSELPSKYHDCNQPNNEQEN